MTIPKIPTVEDFFKQSPSADMVTRIEALIKHPSFSDRALDLRRLLYSRYPLRKILEQLNELEYEALCLKHRLTTEPEDITTITGAYDFYD